jgi:hypothetical protein
MMKVHQGDAVWDGEFSLLGTDMDDGTSVWLKEREDGGFDIRIDQNLEPLIEANAEAVKASEGRRFGDWNRFGSVPDSIAQSSGLDKAWEQKDTAWVKRWFNDSDNRAFRTSRGKV